MRLVALDSETALIRPARLAPSIVCLTWQEAGSSAGIAHHASAEPLLRRWLEDDAVRIIGHNLAFDMAVFVERWPHLRDLVFRAYRANRCVDTMLRQQLIDIAAGCYRGRVDGRGKRTTHTYDLEATAKRNAGMVLQKDALRTSYEWFIDTPLPEWPARMVELQAQSKIRLSQIYTALDAQRVLKRKDRNEPLVKALEKEAAGLEAMIASDPSRCTEYPLDDARATLAVYLAQEKHATYLADQFRQARGAWALYLNSAWGICVDGEGVEILKRKIQEDHDELDEWLREAGLVKPDGVRDTKAAKARMLRICAEEDLPVIRTEAHFKPDAKCGGADDCTEHVCLDADACERTGDELLIAYAERTTLGKQLSNDIPALEKGTLYPIHTKYGLAATGRSTSSKPNIQNQSNRPGFREAFVARPGMLFAECDYPTLELYTLAQCCVSWLGRSKLAEALLSGKDPHLWVASIILDKSYEWCLANKTLPEVQKARKQAKPANFGFGGGMGIKKFVLATRKAVVKEDGREAWEALDLTEDRAFKLKEQWFQAWPELPEYFARVNAACDNDSNRAMVETLFTGRWRGQATYCAACNNGFQALGSDCAKNAGFLIAEQQFTNRKSPLYNTRTVAFVHDEFIIETKDDSRAHDAAYALAQCMVDGANEFLPDVPISMSKMAPLLMKRWSKKAEARFDDSHRLIAWAA